ncbi:MAG: J domain-containing protein [Actinomycetia bacterium]|nr:J domain-containing protein [Actinomycetes bacterium]
MGQPDPTGSGLRRPDRPDEVGRASKEVIRAVATHYEVLDIARTANHADIRQAYHRAARRWHPDGFVDQSRREAGRAEAEMRRINQAWEVLSDEARRRTYDLELRRGVGGGGVGANGSGRTVSDDGVIQIDPRLLDPSLLAARRLAQGKRISNRSSLVLRAVPVLAVLGLLGAIFVFTAYARDNPDVATTTTSPAPNLGSGIVANDCVTVLTGPALLERPCDAGADGRVIGARLEDGVCPLATIREVLLMNGVVACLGVVS